MQLNFRGTSFNVRDPIVGVVRRNYSDFDLDKKNILFADKFADVDFNKNSFSAYIIKDSEGKISNRTKLKNPIIYDIPFLDHLEDGDIVSIFSDGVLRTLFKRSHTHNSIFVTDRCNSNCLMCSQPPKNREDIPYFYSINRNLPISVDKSIIFLVTSLDIISK